MKKTVILSLTLLYSFFTHSTSVDTGAKHDWVVASDPSKQKSENEFDVIVVGSGVGGLSCASLLSSKGYKVLVLEKHSEIGGFFTSYMRDGFMCDTGAEDVSGVHKLGATTNFLKMIGLNSDEVFTQHSRTYIIGDKEIVTTGQKNNSIQQITKHYPHEAQAIQAFFDEGQKAYEEFVTSKFNPSVPCPTYLQWKSVTYQQKLDEFFSDNELKELFCALLPHIDLSADKATASLALLACLQYYIYGGCYPKGGPIQFVNTLQKIIEKNDGTVLTSCGADTILVNNGQVSGVQAGDKIFFSPIVVSNANAKTTFLKLVPEGAIDPEFINAIDALELSFSAVQVILGVDMDLSHLSSKIRVVDQDKECFLVITSNIDPHAAPQGKAVLTSYVDAMYKETPQPGTPAYAQFKKEKLQASLKKIESVIPGISKHVVFTEILTPRSFERFTGMPQGAIYTFDQSIRRPYFKTPLKGLYLSSASTEGCGIEAVIVAGMICAGDITRK